MKKTILSFVILFLFSTGFGQKRPNELQVLPYVRLDWYPEFSFNYGGRASTDRLKMRGTSVGLNINYKYALQNNINVIGGVGYYKYSFNKLSNKNTLFGASDSRDIEYPSMINLAYNTYSYHYNSLSLAIGIEKFWKVNQNIQVGIGLSMNNFFIFQQVYKFHYKNIIYRTNNKSLFAQSVFVNAGIEKKIGKLKIGPQLIIPLFDAWHKDDAFQEDNSEKRNKWLNGIGLGIQINYPLIIK